jgi:hypothetical protein
MKRALPLFVPSLTGCVLVASLVLCRPDVSGARAGPLADGPPPATLGTKPICIKASYLPHNHGFRPREHPPYNTHSLQVIGDSFGVFFFVYTTLSGELA